MISSLFVLKELITKGFLILFQAVGGCGLEVNLRARIIGVAPLSERLVGPRVLEGTCIVGIGL